MALGLALLLAACSSTADPSIVGAWDGQGEAGTGTSLTLHDDGTALWVLDPATASGSYRVHYALDESATPARLDLFGFDRGPLHGLTLYGIAELTDPNTMRFDCEPGPAGGDGAGIRPSEFTRETVSYTRGP